MTDSQVGADQHGARAAFEYMLGIPRLVKRIAFAAESLSGECGQRFLLSVQRQQWLPQVSNRWLLVHGVHRTRNLPDPDTVRGGHGALRRRMATRLR